MVYKLEENLFLHENSIRTHKKAKKNAAARNETTVNSN
jgi:hypothetical protein